MHEECGFGNFTTTKTIINMYLFSMFTCKIFCFEVSTLVSVFKSMFSCTFSFHQLRVATLYISVCNLEKKDLSGVFPVRRLPIRRLNKNCPCPYRLYGPNVWDQG